MVVASLKITVKETENLQPAVGYMTCNVLKKGAWDKLILSRASTFSCSLTQWAWATKITWI